jgi:hypothetical protein
VDPAQQNIPCPQCGAPAPFRGTAVSLVCEFCDSTVVRTGADIKLVGKVSAIFDTGSPILLNSRGKLHKLPFEVSGRLQVTYDRGTWNEWFISFADGTIGWLSDAQGQYAMVRPKDPGSVAGQVPPFDEIETGSELVVGGIRAVVTDKRGASYLGAEGILPFEAQPGMTFYGIDLRGYRREFLTLDYGTAANHQTPALYVGQAVRLPALELQPLRRFEGWR